MSLPYIFFLALGVSLDSFAISVCKGINAAKPIKLAFMSAFCFTLFQIIMPVTGFVLGQAFENIISSFDHYIVFGVLFIFGVNMFKEAFSKTNIKQNTGFWSIFLLAFFSSFDSLGVGITLAVFEINIYICVGFICILTFICSFAGVFVGRFFGEKHKKISCIISGVILCLLAIKILVEHLI